MKQLPEYISEKLKVNKDYETVNNNVEFSNEFKDDIDELQWERFFDKYDSVEDIRAINGNYLPAKYAINISLDFYKIHKENNQKIFFGYSSVNRSEKGVKYYNTMMKYTFDNKDEMEFVYERDLENSFYIREFMLPDRMMLLMGPKQITATSLFGVIMFIHIDK